MNVTTSLKYEDSCTEDTQRYVGPILSMGKLDHFGPILSMGKLEHVGPILYMGKLYQVGPILSMGKLNMLVSSFLWVS